MATSSPNTLAIVAMQSTAPTPEPPISATDAASWAVLVAACAWGVRQLVDLVVHKEKKEGELTEKLINGLQDDRKNLIEGNQRGFDRVVDAVGSQTVRTSEELRDLNHLITRFTETLHRDVQSTMAKQADIYVETKREISKMRSLIEELDRKFDGILQEFESTKTKE